MQPASMPACFIQVQTSSSCPAASLIASSAALYVTMRHYQSVHAVDETDLDGENPRP